MNEELKAAQLHHALSEAVKARAEGENTGVTMTRAKKYAEFLIGNES